MLDRNTWYHITMSQKEKTFKKQIHKKYTCIYEHTWTGFSNLMTKNNPKQVDMQLKSINQSINQ